MIYYSIVVIALQANSIFFVTYFFALLRFRSLFTYFGDFFKVY